MFYYLNINVKLKNGQKKVNFSYENVSSSYSHTFRGLDSNLFGKKIAINISSLVLNLNLNFNAISICLIQF